MEYRSFGSSPLQSSVVGFGCWEMGGTYYGPVEDSDAVRAIHRAIDLGVSLFDTAPAYGFGHSEELLGRALGAGARRSRWSARARSAGTRSP